MLAEVEQFEVKRKLELATRMLVGFGMPIPVKPPTSREKENLSKKKTRGHNQLGLKPGTVKRESSEGDNDVDEEVKLAVVASIPTAERSDIRSSCQLLNMANLLLQNRSSLQGQNL